MFRGWKSLRMEGSSPRIANHHNKQFEERQRPMTDSLPSLSPEVKQIALEALEECADLQAFGRKMLEAILNAAISAKADEASTAPAIPSVKTAATATVSGDCPHLRET